MAVEGFSADIMAYDPQTGSRILIENQLEATDHTHLGQIMTYLAGLEADVVVWIAASFREPHLSAVRWLNEHTADSFSFFAVRLRVVRIGDSPLAPIFEVVEKPNDWDRSVKQKFASEGASYYDVKQEFWHRMLERHPDLGDAGFQPWRYSANYVTLHERPQVQLATWLGKTESGAYVRSAWGEPAASVASLIEPHRTALERALDAELGPNGRGHFLTRSLNKGHVDQDKWPEIMDWMQATIGEYRAAFANVDLGDLG